MTGIRLPDLTRAALAVRDMQRGVIVLPAKPGVEAASLLARIRALEVELAKEREEQARRAHREDRVKAITLRVVDGRAAWRAKMGLRREALVVIQSHQITTADVWQARTDDD